MPVGVLLAMCFRRNDFTGEDRGKCQEAGHKGKKYCLTELDRKMAAQMGWIEKERTHSVERKLPKIKIFQDFTYFREDVPWKDSMSP